MTEPTPGGDLPDDTVVGWVSIERARIGWPDADVMEDTELVSYLQTAYEQCLAFAPALADGADVPESYRVAQVYQARATWRAATENTSSSIGPDGLAVVTYPLDWTVQQLLRPRTGVPAVR